ncbi:MAG: ATP-binding protein [Bifidobacteriaceae bacterium]|nr:ATP-binding protein [Bifidobacteriaceae bacterium]
MYIPRHAEATLTKLAQMFGAVLVTGSRQVGKSTLIEHAVPEVPMLTMDNAAVLQAATTAPDSFFSYNPPPVFIDEAQKAPQLFPAVKQVVDSTKGKGLVYLSGSEQFEMMAGVSESLSGRVGIITLMGVTLREQSLDPDATPFLPSPGYLSTRRPAVVPLTPDAVWERIHRGSMPELVADPAMDWSLYYGSYVRTYIGRDIRRLAQVDNEMRFQQFMEVVAARTGQLLNLADIASSVGVAQPTAKRWMSILRTSGLVYLLRPFQNNLTSRAIKTPKLYVTDTGLAAYLSRWTTPEVLRSGAMAGAYLETFAIMEALKSYRNAGVLDEPFYFFRDKDKREIDLIIVRDGIVHPLEVKATPTPSPRDIAAFKVLDTVPGVRRGPGGVICLAGQLLPLTSTDAVIPVHYL